MEWTKALLLWDPRSESGRRTPSPGDMKNARVCECDQHWAAHLLIIQSNSSPWYLWSSHRETIISDKSNKYSTISTINHLNDNSVSKVFLKLSAAGAVGAGQSSFNVILWWGLNLNIQSESWPSGLFSTQKKKLQFRTRTTYWLLSSIFLRAPIRSNDTNYDPL